MKVGIFINTTKSQANTAANIFGGMLHDNGIDSKVVNLKEDCKDIDVIAVFGGDGTILRVVEYAIEYDIPVLAINEGTVGFLSSVESNELQKAVDIIINGGEIQKRSVIKSYLNGKKFYSLNEVIVERISTTSALSGVAKLSLDINGQFVDNYNVDGLIIATPTGSTAYSLSAGGSIISPDVNAFIVTPICPHSLHNRPIVYSDNAMAKITVLDNSSKCGLFVDGRYVKEVKVGDTIDVLKSKKSIKFYKSNEKFFEKLLLKLNKWSGTR